MSYAVRANQSPVNIPDTLRFDDQSWDSGDGPISADDLERNGLRDATGDHDLVFARYEWGSTRYGLVQVRGQDEYYEVAEASQHGRDIVALERVGTWADVMATVALPFAEDLEEVAEILGEMLLAGGDPADVYMDLVEHGWADEDLRPTHCGSEWTVNDVLAWTEDGAVWYDYTHAPFVGERGDS